MNSASLWRHSDFMRLWSGQTLSVFGSMVGSAAMSFTAILFLHATPFQMGVLNVMQTLPGFLASLFAGAWADRMRRRPILIGADLGRAFVLTSIPLAAWWGFLQIQQVYIVALLVSILSIGPSGAGNQIGKRHPLPSPLLPRRGRWFRCLERELV